MPGRLPPSAMQDAELLAKRPSNNEQRFYQYRQVGEVLDKVFNARFELHLPDYAALEAEVAQRNALIPLLI